MITKFVGNAIVQVKTAELIIKFKGVFNINIKIKKELL